MLPEFRNEPMTDFSVEGNARAFRAALAAIEKRLPIRGENRIGGRRAGASKHFESVNPCDFRQVIGRFEARLERFLAGARVPAPKRSRCGRLTPPGPRDRRGLPRKTSRTGVSEMAPSTEALA